MKRILLCVLATSLVTRSLVAAEFRVADVFADNGVLQQDLDLPVWGTAIPGKLVTVRFAGQTKETNAASDGSWKVELSPLKADGTGKTMIVESGDQQQQIRSLLVGEVWYASGQSNMQMKLSACAKKLPTIRDIVAAKTEVPIRILRIDEPDSPQPLARRELKTVWQRNTPANRRNQSAVAYFFARQLHAQLGVPIGIIEGSWGGKPIEGFIPRAQFEEHESLSPLLSLAESNRLDELAKLKGGVIVRNSAGMPGRIFNARVAPIAPYAMRGFIWYQGESNAGNGEDPRHYQIKMQALIEGWRAAWERPDLPCYFTQLPAFKDDATGWIRLREEQRRSLSISNTGMAVTIDLRDSDIHPANKIDVGKRLALWALAKNYGKQIAFSGPLFKSATIETDSIRVKFQHADGGLMVAHKEGVNEVNPTPDVALAHFELADAEGNWFPAQATIDADIVRVSSNAVSKPQAVRYACSGAPQNANLYNTAGLPASPFCSELRLLPWQQSP